MENRSRREPGTGHSARTIWRGMSIEVPADWELSAISRTKDVERLTFASRYHERLRLIFRSVPREPDLRNILNDQIQKHSPENPAKIHNLPGNWMGAYLEKDEARFTYGLNYFPANRLLVEAVILWPVQRETTLEATIYGSISPPREKKDRQTWSAMGVDLQAPQQYELASWRALVGRIEWEFSLSRKKRENRRFTLRRLAMPEYWLKTPLEEWLPTQLDKKVAAKATVESMRWNTHPAWRMTSPARTSLLLRLSGRKPFRLDLAWECPREKRVYHLTWDSDGLERAENLLREVSLECCRPPASEHFRSKTRDDEPCTSASGEALSASLGAVVFRNEVMTTEADSRGGLVLSVPVKRARVLKPPLSWILPYSSSRRIGLDPLGAELLGLCDGQRTIEEIIAAFAENHLLTFREASLPAVKQLVLLSQRGIVVIAGSAPPEGEAVSVR